VQDELKVTVESPGEVKRKLTVEVPAAEVDRRYASVVKDYRRRVAMPGFRKGKVPADVVRRLYAGDITGDVARALVTDAFEAAVRRESLVPVSEPEFEIVTLAEGKDLTFTAAFEILPKVEPRDYLGLEIPAESAEVAAEEVARLIEEIRETHATVRTLEEARGVREGDVAVITFEGTVAGEPIPSGSGKDFPLVIGSGSFPPGFEDNLIGAVAGERREFTLHLPEDFGAKELAGRDALFIVTVQELRERVLPELDDAFAKDVGDYAGIDDLRAKVAERVRATKEAAAAGRRREAVLGKLLEANPLPVPATMVERRLAALVEDAERYLVMRGVPWEEVEKQRPQIRQDAGPTAERKVRATLLLEAIAEREGVAVTEEDLAAEIARIAASNRLEPAEVRRRLVKNGTLESLRSALREDKALDFLIERAVTP
jgi:trigger factor